MGYYSTTLQKGSKGDETKRWQEFLNTQGYNLAVDGDFGDKTDAATRDYQTKNGLTVDGIVGKNTWGKAGYKPSQSSKPFEYDNKTYKNYEEGDAVNSAETALNTHLESKPEGFTPKWQDQIDGIMKEILGRKDFSYDLNGDALYQQYREKYIQQGKMAMQDTMGQAAAMTGGYGNSYAQSVGQQAYQAQLENLNDIVPELYQMALDKYNQEGQELYNQYGLLSDAENQEYGRYRDKVADYLTERDYLAGRYDSERSFDYSKYADERAFDLNKDTADRNFAYQKYRDDIADEQWVKQYDALYGNKATGGSNGGSGGSGGSGGNGGGNYDNGGLSDSEIKELQEVLGVSIDGRYGPKSKEAAGGLSAKDAYNKYVRNRVQPTKNNNTTAFMNRYQTKSEYLARGHSEKEFNEYMEDKIATFLHSDRLTESEALYLIQYYGLS